MEVFLHEWIKSVIIITIIIIIFFFATSVWKVVTSFIVYIHIFFHNESMIELINSIVKKKQYIYIYIKLILLQKKFLCVCFIQSSNIIYIYLLIVKIKRKFN